MIKRRTLIFIGPCGGDSVPDNGASLKNYHLLKRLRELGVHVLHADTENWRKNPLILLKILFILLTHPQSKYIVSANSMSSYRLFKMMKLFAPQSKIIYWVIGGSIADWIKEGKVSNGVYKRLEWIIVEGDSMKKTLEECGFKNVMVLPNFKRIDYIPNKLPKKDNKVKFVFLSRIVESKGCGVIVEAAKFLNKKCANQYIVDFYGNIDSNYQNFKEDIKQLPNVRYKGFLDLRKTENYDILASYDVMLFPTYWHGEGFPGVLIDAFISGLPVIATNWHMNSDILEENKTGLFIRPRDTDDLARAMSALIDAPDKLANMSVNCQKKAIDYSTESVINASVLSRVGIC